MRATRALRTAALPAAAATGLAVALAVPLAGAGHAARPTPSPGSTGAGDPYFPRQGNGGYDALSYRIAVAYQPDTRHLSGRTRITAVAKKSLSRFSLDLRRNLRASRVSVNGRPAAFAQPAALVQELVVTPGRALRAGTQFTVVVRYAGRATPVSDPDGSPDGWNPTPDGALVASEPQGSPSWFPGNDTPGDKARFAVAITVPRGVEALGPGELRSVERRKATTTWDWRLKEPVSSYLVTATSGQFQLSRGRTPRGIPYVTAVDPSQRKASRPVLAKMPAMVDYFADVLGKYPFSSIGSIVDDAPSVGYALEAVTKPVYDRAPDETTVAHEIAHQWFGNSVTLRRWRDIWLNEGFAEFGAWLWDEHTGVTSAAEHLDDLLAVPAGSSVWNPPPANPGGPEAVFAESVYQRGAGALQALREKVGDQVFFAVLRGWLKQHAYGNTTVPQFTAYAERVAGRDLTPFFQRWLYAAGKP